MTHLCTAWRPPLYAKTMKTVCRHSIKHIFILFSLKCSAGGYTKELLCEEQVTFFLFHLSENLHKTICTGRSRQISGSMRDTLFHKLSVLFAMGSP
jgi:hypothetical protein